MKKGNKYVENLIFYKKDIENSNVYKTEKNGNLDKLKIYGKDYECYNIYVKTLLSWDLVKLLDKNLQEINVNSKHYADCYVKGYVEGQKEFINKYENDPRETKETIVKNIMNLNKDVNKVLTVNQYVLNDKVFEDYGYYSGIRFEMLRFEREKKAFFDEVLKPSNPNNYNINYFDLVINGFTYNSKFLKAYFIRQQKLAFKNEFIELKDFFIGCKEIISELKKEVEFQYYSGINDLCLIQDKLEAEPSKENIKKLESLQDYEKQVKSKNKKFSIKNQQNGFFAANLSLNAALHLENSIIEAEKNSENKDESKGLNKNMKPTIDDDIIKVKKIINPLSGYWNKNQILSKNDFEIFTDYVSSIVENKCLPDEVYSFPNTGAPIKFIRKTIHHVYVYLGKQNKDVWVSLAHLFKQFDNTETTTTNSKFSAYSSQYDNDLKNMITY